MAGKLMKPFALDKVVTGSTPYFEASRPRAAEAVAVANEPAFICTDNGSDYKNPKMVPVFEQEVTPVRIAIIIK